MTFPSRLFPFIPRLRLSAAALACWLFLLPAGDAAAGLPPGFTDAVVVSADSLATAAGLAVLRSGGNAVDAAVAVGFVLAVTYPEAGNLAGGGFMLLHLRDGRERFIDFRETAPAASTRTMFLDGAGNPVPKLSTDGALAAAVPGTVAGLLHALTAFGTMDRRDVLGPAVTLAREGFRVGDRLAASLLEQEPTFASDPAVRKVFMRDGRTLRSGERLVQPDLSETLRDISDAGEAGFYEGEVAELIRIAMVRGGGIITKDDLAAYRPVDRAPLVGSYRGYTVVTAPPPSAGGITILQMLNSLEAFPPGTIPFQSPSFYHLVAVAAQFSYADRFVYAGDPSFVPIPVAQLTSKSYTAARLRGVATDRAVPGTNVTPGIGEPAPGGETTHYCVVDQDGNVASVTVSLNDVYGGKVFVEGGGFFLNNVMDDFVVKPGFPNLYGLTGGSSNEIAPGRRMASSMSPTIVLQGDSVRLVIGARGGSRIPTTIVQVIAGVIDYGFGLTDAVAVPRIHHQWIPDDLFVDEPLLGTETAAGLEAMGYRVVLLPSSPGRVQAVERRNGRYYGVSDQREGGAAGGF